MRQLAGLRPTFKWALVVLLACLVVLDAFFAAIDAAVKELKVQAAHATVPINAAAAKANVSKNVLGAPGHTVNDVSRVLIGLSCVLLVLYVVSVIATRQSVRPVVDPVARLRQAGDRVAELQREPATASTGLEAQRAELADIQTLLAIPDDDAAQITKRLARAGNPSFVLAIVGIVLAVAVISVSIYMSAQFANHL